MDKLSNIVGLIKFIVILDNNGKRIYSRYFTRGDMLNDIPAQKDFEKKICQTVVNLNVNRSNEGKSRMLN